MRLNTDIRIPVTADQKRLIAAAVADEPGGLAAWARRVLSRAADERAASLKEPGHERGASDMGEFLGEVNRLSQSRSIHAAGDLIFGFVHGLMWSRDFSSCDRLKMLHLASHKVLHDGPIGASMYCPERRSRFLRAVPAIVAPRVPRAT